MTWCQFLNWLSHSYLLENSLGEQPASMWENQLPRDHHAMKPKLAEWKGHIESEMLVIPQLFQPYLHKQTCEGGWWLILCINLIGLRNDQVTGKHYFSIYLWECIWKRIALELVDWVVKIPSRIQVGIIQSIQGLNRVKRWR